MNKYLLPALAVIILILVAGLGYFIFQNQILVKKLAGSPTPTPTPTSSAIATPQISPKPSPTSKLTIKELQDNIEASVNSGNFAALTSYMTNPVEVILQATECCGPLSPAESENQMNYIEAGAPFDFGPTNNTIVNLKAKNSELAGKFIGISKNSEHLIAFGINNQNQITDIRMSVSWKLFNQ